MNISRQNIYELTARINIQVGKTDYEERVNNVLKDYRKKVTMPGFRPGKTPISLIQKMYGKAILIDELNKIIGESLDDYIKAENLQIIGEPLPAIDQKPLDIDNDSDFEFAFEIGIQPEVKFEWPKKDKLKIFEIESSDEDINFEIEYYRNRYGKFETISEVDENSVVDGSLKQIDENNQLVENGFEIDYIALDLNKTSDEEQKKLFIGAKINDAINFNLRKWFNNDNKLLANALHLKEEEVVDIPELFQLKIENIQKFKPAEVDEQLFKAVFPDSQISSAEEFKEKIKQELLNDYYFETRSKNISNLREYLLNAIEVNLPENFIRRFIEKKNEEENKDNKIDIDKEFPEVLKSFKWQIIKNQFAKDFNIKIEEKDVLEYMRRLLKFQFKVYYGFIINNEEELNKYAYSSIKNANEFNRVVNEIIESRILEIAQSNAKLDKETMTIKEFYDRMTAENQKKADN